MNAATNAAFVVGDVGHRLHSASLDESVVRMLVQENQLVMDCKMEMYRWQLTKKNTKVNILLNIGFVYNFLFLFKITK